MSSSGANQAVAENVCGVGSRIKVCSEFVVFVAVNYAVVDFAVELDGVSVAIGGVVVIIVEEQSFCFSRRACPVVGDGAVCQKIVAAACQCDAIVSAVIYQQIRHPDAVTVGVNAHSCVVFDNCVVDVSRSHVVFQHPLNLQSDESVSDDGVVNAVPVTFARFHKPDSVPLPRLVGVKRFESVALKHNRIFRCSVDY